MAFKLGIPRAVYIGDEDQAIRLLLRLPGWKVVGLDTETDGLNRMQAQIAYWSLANEEERYCIPRSLLHLFKDFLEDRKVEFADHNANFDAHMMANAGIAYASDRIVANRYDTMTMHTLIDDTSPHSLDYITVNLLEIPGGKLFSFKERFGKVPIHEIIPGHSLFEDMVDYASFDAWLHLQAFLHIKDRMQEEETYFGTMWDYYKTLECPLHDVIFNMERRGVMINKGYLIPQRKVAEKLMNDALEGLAKVAGRYINPASVPQMRDLFYEQFGMPIKKKTKGGKSGNQQGATDEEVLSGWATRKDKVGEASRLVLEYRQHNKLLGTYINGMIDRIDPRTGRIHSTFTQHVARTGRLSSKDPNLQNLPRPENDPYGLRKAFIPEVGERLEDDWVLLLGDYSQVEMMLAASDSGDANMLKAIHNGMDLHCNSVSLMFGVPYEKVKAAKKKKDQGLALTADEKRCCLLRQQCKTIGFGILYGEGPKKLSEQLEISFEEAKRLQNQYFRAFPTLKQHIEDVGRIAEESNVAITTMGRRRRLENASNYSIGAKRERFEALRQAFNFTVQGFAAEIVKLAMLECARDRELRELNCHLLLQVHDELVFECPPTSVKRASSIIKDCMLGVCPDLLQVNLNTDIGGGRNWQEAK